MDLSGPLEGLFFDQLAARSAVEGPFGGPFLFGVGGMRERLIDMAEPLLQGLGYELVDIEYAATRSQATVRVYIDWPEGRIPKAAADELAARVDDDSHAFDGIGVEDCERVSRELSALLDVQDPISVPYALEVSSPGMDRILRTAAHYVRHVGQRVHVELKVPREGRRRYTGELRQADADGIELIVDGTKVSVRLSEIGKTRLAPDWSRAAQRK
jgi:ribosome maturation factor RimP